jgi:hypothetical protein
MVYVVPTTNQLYAIVKELLKLGDSLLVTGFIQLPVTSH